MIAVGTSRGVMIGAVAQLIEQDSQLQAWAERHVRQDPDIRWMLGNYVEADEPNSNGHIFPLDELMHAQRTLAGKPLNMMHREHYIIGSFAGAQLVTAEGVEITNDAELTAAEVGDAHPHVEALAGMWHNRFSEEYFNIRRAHAEGSLYFSMEAIPEQVSCPSCHVKAEFAGVKSDSYCEHMNGATGPKILHNPTFAGGAVIIPPVQPGWKRADVTAISRLIRDHAEEAEAIYAQLEREAPEMEAKQWEAMMAFLLKSVNTPDPSVEARDFSTEDRSKMSEEHKAMPDGSYPIMTVEDLKNAIRAIGRTPAGKRAAVKRHIRKRAVQLGHPEMIPPNW
jgi:hypothetical protein